jgi:hypothetical protein
MREGSRVSMSDASRVFVLPRLAFGSLEFFAFANDGYSQKSHNTGGQFNRFASSLLSEHVSRFEKPIARFPGGRKAVFIESTPVANACARICLEVVRAYRTERPAQLIGHVIASRIGSQQAQVIPGAISDEKRQSIRSAMPHRVSRYFERKGPTPGTKLFFERHAECSPGNRDVLHRSNATRDQTTRVWSPVNSRPLSESTGLMHHA